MSPHPGVRHAIERAAAGRIEQLFRSSRAADRAHRLGLQPLSVSRGVGCDVLPVRLFAPSKIVLCEITGTMSTTDERRA